MVWLGAGMDAADGQLSAQAPLVSWPWVRDLDLEWDPEHSKGVFRSDPRAFTAR